MSTPTTQVIEPTAPDIHEDIHQELRHAQSEVEELQDDLEMVESKSVAIEQYLSLLEEGLGNGVNSHLDYYGKKLLTVGMEQLGYPLNLNSIAVQYNGSTQRQQLAIAIESMSEVAKNIWETIKEIFKRFMLAIESLFDKISIAVSGHSQQLDILTTNLNGKKDEPTRKSITLTHPNSTCINGQFLGNIEGCTLLKGVTEYVGNEYPNAILEVLGIIQKAIKDKELIPSEGKQVKDDVAKLFMEAESLFLKKFPKNKEMKTEEGVIHEGPLMLDNHVLQLVVRASSEFKGSPYELRVLRKQAKIAPDSLEVTIPTVGEIKAQLKLVGESVANITTFIDNKAKIKKEILSLEKEIEALFQQQDKQSEELSSEDRYIGYFNLNTARVVTDLMNSKFTHVLTYCSHIIRSQLALLDMYIESYPS